MREILFRGQCEATNEWVYGLPVTETTLSNSISHISQYSGTERKFGRTNVKIKPESIGQFTGLLDRKGNKIFEGDLCRFKWNPILNEPSDLFTFELPVVYYKIWGCWCFHLKTNKMNEPQKGLFTDYSIEEKYVAIGSPIEYAENPSDGVEILGNIHEKSKL